MNILYYIPYIEKTWGGVYQYAFKLLEALVENQTSGQKFYVYILHEDESYMLLSKKYPNIQLILEKDKPNLTEPYLANSRPPYDIAQPSLINTKAKTPRIVRAFAKRYNHRVLNKYKRAGYEPVSFLDLLIKRLQINVIHCPFQHLYAIDNIPAITTMHDVQELHFPDFFSSAERAYRAVNYKHAIDNANAVIVSYEHVKSDIIRFFEKPSDMVHVCQIHMKDMWFDTFNQQDVLNLGDYNLPQKFILYPAATWPHKNHLKLLEAIHYLKSNGLLDISLVLTGHQTANYITIKNKIQELKLTENVVSLGIVSNQVLYSLYQKASAVVIPTLYEAGSYPLMESILMGVPVICSNVTSLPETINNKEFTFNPNAFEDIAEKIRLIVTDQAFILANIENSKKQAVMLRKNEIALKVNFIYRKIVQESST